MQVEGNKTFTAYIAADPLPAYRIVKVKSGTATDPPQVELVSAGEFGIGVTQHSALSGQPIAVKLWQSCGTFGIECTVSAAIARGTALYAAANGKASDAASGTSIGVSAQAAGASTEIIEVIPNGGISTTAAAVSVADASNHWTATTAEALSTEIGVDLHTAQYLIQPAGAITLETGAPTLVFVNGVSDGFTQLTNKEVGLRFNNNATPTKFAARFIIPPDLNPAADIVVHFLGALIKAGGALVDSPTITCEAYFAAVGESMLADADCGGVSGEFLTAQTDKYQEKTLAIALADIPAVQSVLTLIFNPTDGELDTDDFVLAGLWIEATRQSNAS